LQDIKSNAGEPLHGILVLIFKQQGILVFFFFETTWYPCFLIILLALVYESKYPYIPFCTFIY